MAKDGLSHQRAEGKSFEEMQLPTQKCVGEPDWSVNAVAPEEMWPGHPETPRREPAPLELLKDQGQR